MAHYSRVLAQEANRLQSKYTFLFDVKPGAGNAIAANHVLKNPNTILATSSAFFVRPIFYPNESYNVDEFRLMMPQCAAPMSVASVKYRSWQEVPTDRPLNIGISGLGVISHLIALQVVNKYPKTVLIPYKSTSEGLLGLVSNQVDLTVGFVKQQEQWGEGTKDQKKVHVLGTTGRQSVNGHPTLVSAGLPAVLSQSDNPHYLIVARTISEEKFNEWRSILTRAASSRAVRDAYAVDYCLPLDQMSERDMLIWFRSQREHWTRLTAGIKIQ